MTKDKNKKESIEVLMKQIEEIIDQLENGEIDLDESIKKYENGMALIEKCKKILKESRLKIEYLKDKAEKYKENEEINEDEDEDEDEEKEEDEDKEEEEDEDEDEEKLF